MDDDKRPWDKRPLFVFSIFVNGRLSAIGESMDNDVTVDLQAPAADYALKAETHTIIGCAFDVLNEPGHGLQEKIYENALVVETARNCF